MCAACRPCSTQFSHALLCDARDLYKRILFQPLCLISQSLSLKCLESLTPKTLRPSAQHAKRLFILLEAAHLKDTNMAAITTLIRIPLLLRTHYTTAFIWRSFTEICLYQSTHLHPQIPGCKSLFPHAFVLVQAVSTEK